MVFKSVYGAKLQAALDRCIASLGCPKNPKLAGGLDMIDSMIGGGFATGDVTVLVGKSGSGKSCLLRQIAVNAAATVHVFYAPLQDGMTDNAAKRLVALVAGLPPSALDGNVTLDNRIRAMEAADALKRLDLGCCAVDGMTFQMLLEASTEDFTGCADEEFIDGTGFILVDGASMLEDGFDPRSIVRALKMLSFGTDVAVVVTVAGDKDAVDAVSDAGCVIALEQTECDDPGVHSISATVMKDNWGPHAGSKAMILIDRETLCVRRPA